jgi:hypothetical protein
MGAEALKAGVSIVTAIIGLAILSVILSTKANTLGLVQNLSSGLAQDLNAATGPITNAGGFGSTQVSFATR